jgi:hypothetical protein
MGERTRREEPRGPNGHGPRGQGIWPRGAYPFAPRGPFQPPLVTTPSSCQKRGRPSFPEIYEQFLCELWINDQTRSRRRRSLYPLPERSDPAATEPRRRGKSTPSFPPLLLGVGGGLYITIITKIRTISIIITVIHFDPLVV